MSASPIPAVGVVVWREDDVLLIQRGREPMKGQWSIPGGKVEWGEGLKDAAARELMEETGVTADLISLIDVIPAIGADYHYILIDYVAIWRAGEPQAGDDAIAAQFVDLKTACARLAWDETRKVIERSYALYQAHREALILPQS